MFEIRNVAKQYHGEFALQDVSLNIGKGLNFIVGASGSGKTTLLKIMSGMEQAFEGDVSYCGKSIKTLSPNEKSYFYNHIFGFVWQDFNLLEDSTVLENVLLPQLLQNSQNQKIAEKALRDLRIFDIAAQKVKYLSGGQKQRVAIARELMKNPQVIIADEPTSALDEKTSKTTMDILRTLSKSRTVIVVTHDTSLIAPSDHIYELDKGELVSKPEMISTKSSPLNMQRMHSLSLGNAFSLAKSNVKNKFGRFAVAAVSLVVASVLLLTTVSGVIAGNTQGEFDKLFQNYGESLTDISLVKGFTDAAGTGGEEDKKPNGEVNQDIGGLYDLYAKDERVSFVSYTQAFDKIKIKADGKEHPIESSGNAPVINKLVAGKMPMGDGNEVVVPESFAKKMGSSPEQALGKEIDFQGEIVDWASGKPVWKPVTAKAKIVGVMDTTTSYDYEGKIQTFTIEDAFLFSNTALKSMVEQAGTDMEKMAVLIRPKTPAAMIEIKDELSEKGIVPLGQFELVEDMVRLNEQTTEQSGSATLIIGLLALVLVIAIFLITGLMRKKEIAIYKVSGFTNAHLLTLNFAEMLTATVAAIALMLVTSPLISQATKALFGVQILDAKMLFTGTWLLVATAVVAYLATAVTFSSVQLSTALKTGDR